MAEPEPCLRTESPLDEGEYVTVAADYGNFLCVGAIEHMDVFVARLMERFQIDADDGDLSICFTWKDTLEEVAELCDSSVPIAGCAPGQKTISPYTPNDHELVHNVASLLGRPPPFFAEGIAVAHEGYDGLLNKIRAPLNVMNPIDFMEMSIEELLAVPFGDGYDVAGRFTGYLMTVHGMNAYLDLYRSLERDADLARIDEVFRATLGVSLDDSVAEYLESWTRCWSDPLLSECEAPEVDWDGEHLEYEEQVNCFEGDAIGPYDGSAAGRAVLHRTITIAEDATYELRLAGETQESTGVRDVPSLIGYPYQGVSLLGCEPCSQDYMETIEGGTPRILRLSPGKYSLRLHAAAIVTAAVAFTLKKVE